MAVTAITTCCHDVRVRPDNIVNSPEAIGLVKFGANVTHCKPLDTGRNFNHTSHSNLSLILIPVTVAIPALVIVISNLTPSGLP